MEFKIIKKKSGSMTCKVKRSFYEKGPDGVVGVVKAGSEIVIDLNDEGRQKWHNLGGLNLLEPQNIPDTGDYLVCSQTDFSLPDGKIRPFAIGDTLSLTREQAIRRMLNAGQVRPVSNEIPDLSFFAPYRYEIPSVRLDENGKPIITADPKEIQEKNRRKAEQAEVEKARGIFEAQCHIESLKKKRPFATAYKP